MMVDKEYKVKCPNCGKFFEPSISGTTYCETCKKTSKNKNIYFNDLKFVQNIHKEIDMAYCMEDY